MPSTQSLQWTISQQLEGIAIFRSGRNLKIVIQKPRNGNALTAAMIAQVTQCFRQASQDDTISRIIITAEGRFFCTGMDLGKSSTAVGKDIDASSTAYSAFTDLFEAIETSPKVTIACINGPCYAGGIGLAFACDVRLSLRSASVTLSEVKLGLCPAIISKYLLREWGTAFTREAMISGRTIPMTELRRIGAVHGLVDDADGLNVMLDSYLINLRKCAPGASAMCKDVVRAGWLHSGKPKQDAAIENVFKKMMGSDAESSIGLRNVQQKKSMDWDGLERISSKL